MHRSLTYKKVFIDSNYRLPQSRSSADFVIELNETFECPNGCKMFVTEVSIPAVWKTCEVGFFEKMYFMLYDDSDVLLRNFFIDLSNNIYYAEQLAFDINSKLNDAVRDLNAGNDIFVYAYSSATRTVELKVADGLSFKLKIPTNDELATYVGGAWNRGETEYDSTNPLSINYLLSNYVPTNGGLTTWNSSYLNLVPFNSVFISCVDLSDGHYAAPNAFSGSIIKKVVMDSQLGGIIHDNSVPLHSDYIDVSNRTLKRMHFRTTDHKNTVMNLYNIPVSFSLIFEHPNY
jgi:hypothetical protein